MRQHPYLAEWRESQLERWRTTDMPADEWQTVVTGPRTAAEWGAVNTNPSPAVRAARDQLKATLERRRASLNEKPRAQVRNSEND